MWCRLEFRLLTSTRLKITWFKWANYLKAEWRQFENSTALYWLSVVGRWAQSCNQSHLSIALQSLAWWTLTLLTSHAVERFLGDGQCEISGISQTSAVKILRKYIMLIHNISLITHPVLQNSNPSCFQRNQGAEHLHFPVPVAESCVKPVTFISACRDLASSSSSQVPRYVQVPAEWDVFQKISDYLWCALLLLTVTLLTPWVWRCLKTSCGTGCKCQLFRW